MNNPKKIIYFTTPDVMKVLFVLLISPIVSYMALSIYTPFWGFVNGLLSLVIGIIMFEISLRLTIKYKDLSNDSNSS